MLNFLSQTKIQLAIVIILTILAYSNIFGNQFVIDDASFIVDWKTKNSFDMVEFFKGSVPSGHEGVYRPIRSVFYALYFSIFGSSVAGYHLHSVLIHLASTVLVYLIVWEIIARGPAGRLPRQTSSLQTNLETKSSGSSDAAGARRKSPGAPVTPRRVSPDLILNRESLIINRLLPFFAALLFGLHPLHTEAITHIASSFDTIGPAFLLLAFYLYLLGKKYYWWSVGAGIAGYFTNEITLALPILIVLYEWTFNKFKVPWPLAGRQISKFKVKEFLVYLPYFAGALVFVLIRFLVLDVSARGPYLANSVYLTFLTMLKVFIKYLTLILWPVNLASNHIISPGIEAFVYRDYRQAAIAAQSILDIDILISLLILSVIIFAGVILRRKYPIVSFGIFWFFISLLPVAEIIPQGAILNERHLYLASFGLILIAGFFLQRFFERGFEYIAAAVLVLVCGFYLSMTFVRNRDWKDNISIWSADVKIYSEENAYAYFQLGNAYAALGGVEQAVNNYQKSYQINSQFVVALGSIAKVYNDFGRQDLAIDFYKKSLEINPYFWEAHSNLATIYVRRGDFDLARKEYEEILKIVPGFTQVSENMKGLPEVAEATSSAKAGDNLWLKYHRISGLSFTLPSKWKMTRSFGGLTLRDETGEFEAIISLSKKDIKETFEDYMKKETENLGTLANEGLALIPNFDKAYVKVWSVSATPEVTGQSTSGVNNAITKLQFFLFKEDNVIKIQASPADSVQMQSFDIVLGSMRIE